MTISINTCLKRDEFHALLLVEYTVVDHCTAIKQSVNKFMPD